MVTVEEYKGGEWREEIKRGGEKGGEIGRGEKRRRGREEISKERKKERRKFRRKNRKKKQSWEKFVLARFVSWNIKLPREIWSTLSCSLSY